MNKLREYLYIDEKRLLSYVEQISSDIHYEKVPSWTFSLGLTGPSIETKLDNQKRQLTNHEKIISLVKYLENNNLLSHYRTGDNNRNHNTVFRMETCRAVQVYIPPRQNSTPVFPGLKIWVSYLPHRKRQEIDDKVIQAGALYLLESLQQSDEAPYGFTSYSALDLLFSPILNELRNSVAHDFVNTYFKNAVEDKENIQDHIDFSVHPNRFFAKLGAVVGQARLIQTLYRIRSTCLDKYSEPRNLIVTVGYPIFITEVTT